MTKLHSNLFVITITWHSFSSTNFLLKGIYTHNPQQQVPKELKRKKHRTIKATLVSVNQTCKVFELWWLVVFKNGCAQNKALNKLTDTFSTSVLIIQSYLLFFLYTVLVCEGKERLHLRSRDQQGQGKTEVEVKKTQRCLTNLTQAKKQKSFGDGQADPNHKKGRANNKYGFKDLRNEILHLLIRVFNINCTKTQKHTSIYILYSRTLTMKVISRKIICHNGCLQHGH